MKLDQARLLCAAACVCVCVYVCVCMCVRVCVCVQGVTGAVSEAWGRHGRPSPAGHTPLHIHTPLQATPHFWTHPTPGHTL